MVAIIFSSTVLRFDKYNSLLLETKNVNIRSKGAQLISLYFDAMRKSSLIHISGFF